MRNWLISLVDLELGLWLLCSTHSAAQVVTALIGFVVCRVCCDITVGGIKTT